MAKIFRKISEARLLNVHFGSLHNWSDRKLKLHSKLFRVGHYIYSVRDTENRYIYSEFSTAPNVYPMLGTIIIDTYRGKILRIKRNQMVKAALGKSGSYPTLDKAVSFKAGSTISKWLTIIKLIIKKGD